MRKSEEGSCQAENKKSRIAAFIGALFFLAVIGVPVVTYAALDSPVSRNGVTYTAYIRYGTNNDCMEAVRTDYAEPHQDVRLQTLSGAYNQRWAIAFPAFDYQPRCFAFLTDKAGNHYALNVYRSTMNCDIQMIRQVAPNAEDSTISTGGSASTSELFELELAGYHWNTTPAKYILCNLSGQNLSWAQAGAGNPVTVDKICYWRTNGSLTPQYLPLA